ncbi:MAG TPA: ABC transporter ATP-binding protein, partial [Lactobacillus sp.]|nr:ABC transporter ATP-binding protein [Lactobacillus sp.]
VLIASHDLLWLQTLVDQTFELTNGQLHKIEDVMQA